jgi:hypothetical protein
MAAGPGWPRKLLWFVALWAAGVLALTTVSFAIRAALLP